MIRFTGAEVMRAPEQCISDIVTIAGLIERHRRVEAEVDDFK